MTSFEALLTLAVSLTLVKTIITFFLKGIDDNNMIYKRKTSAKITYLGRKL